MNMSRTLFYIGVVALAFPLNSWPTDPGAPKASSVVLKAFYDMPREARRIESSRAGAVMVCTDDCEAFTIRDAARSEVLWDAVLLFKAFLSKSLIDQEFASRNHELARGLLDTYARGTCKSLGNDERVASCVLTKLSKDVGLRITRQVFDEGQRCDSKWTFELPPKLLGYECHKVNR